MKKQCLSAFLSIAAVLTLFSGTAQASVQRSFGENPGSGFTLPLVEAAAAGSAELAPVHTTNVNGQEYTNGFRWKSPNKSFLYENEGGGLTRVEQTGKKVIVEDYDSTCHLLAQAELEVELPLWGGFYAGKDSNFLIFGQENREQDNQKEVIRVVKYSKSWNREGAASLCGANTTVPFSAGSLSAVEYGDLLYIRTCHEMYQNARGENHQANLTFSVKKSNMSIVDLQSIVSNEECGYVSHSFNQWVAMDNDRLIAVDHGDAYPRSIALFRYRKSTGSQMMDNGYDEICDYVSVLPIRGEIGDNDTGVTVGGLGVSSTSYLVAGTSVAQDASYNPRSQRNVFVTSTEKNNFSSSKTEIHWITDYTADNPGNVSTPHLVKIVDDRFLLLYSSGRETVNYVFLDGQGRITSPMYTMEGRLSDCKPIAYQGVVVWYYTSSSEPIFCVIDGEGNGFKMNS